MFAVCTTMRWDCNAGTLNMRQTQLGIFSMFFHTKVSILIFFTENMITIKSIPDDNSKVTKISMGQEPAV